MDDQAQQYRGYPVAAEMFDYSGLHVGPSEGNLLMGRAILRIERRYPLLMALLVILQMMLVTYIHRLLSLAPRVFKG